MKLADILKQIRDEKLRTRVEVTKTAHEQMVMVDENVEEYAGKSNIKQSNIEVARHFKRF